MKILVKARNPYPCTECNTPEVERFLRSIMPSESTIHGGHTTIYNGCMPGLEPQQLTVVVKALLKALSLQPKYGMHDLYGVQDNKGRIYPFVRQIGFRS